MKCWRIASNAKTRCNNPNYYDFALYGGRGIKYLLTNSELESLWSRDGASQMKRPSIDRINPDGNYEFGNCRYVEMVENSRLGGIRSGESRSKCNVRHPGIPGNKTRRPDGRMACVTCATIRCRESRFLRKRGAKR